MNGALLNDLFDGLGPWFEFAIHADVFAVQVVDLGQLVLLSGGIASRKPRRPYPAPLRKGGHRRDKLSSKKAHPNLP